MSQGNAVSQRGAASPGSGAHTGVVVGVDCGLTVTKAVVYDRAGTWLGTACAPSGQHSPRPRWVERDMDELWRTASGVVRDAIADADVPASAVRAVATTAHGDGLYLVDADGKAVRPGILSLDTRAADIVEQWRTDGTADRALLVTGQQPFPASPAALLAWLARHEPRTLARARWAMSSKDWVKFKLTGEPTTDLTEASESFTSHLTQRYADEALVVYGLEPYARLRPPVLPSCEIAGKVTGEAAEVTGLPPGTPVVAGLHDVDACAIGGGSVHPGDLAVIAGTYSINEVISDAPVTDPRWCTRNFVSYGYWQHMALSPASATNLEWFVRQLCPDEVARADRAGESPFAFVEDAVRGVTGDPHDVLFLPFLYGSPQPRDSGAALIGLRGWHDRRHALRAVLDGIVFNHRTHVDALRERFTIRRARLTGGGARNPYWSQLFADVLALPVDAVEVPEAGTLGAAVCAMIGAGWYPSVTEAVDNLAIPTHGYQPDPTRGRRLDTAYERYRWAAGTLANLPEPLSD